MTTVYEGFTGPSLDLCKANLTKLREALRGTLSASTDAPIKIYGASDNLAEDARDDWRAYDVNSDTPDGIHTDGSMCQILADIKTAKEFAIGNAQLQRDLGIILEAFSLLGFQASSGS